VGARRRRSRLSAFRRDADGDDEGGGTAGFESLLDVCLSFGLVRKRLRRHDRSRREGMIAFSNKFFYDGGLVTFEELADRPYQAHGVKASRSAMHRSCSRLDIRPYRHLCGDPDKQQKAREDIAALNKGA
jgi:hypothetical protein